MNYLEYESKMKIGEILYVCDLRENVANYTEKPIRHVRPTKVMVFDNSDTKERVYYTEIHFRPFSKNGTVLKKVIKPYDNTGYRGFTGVSVNIFYTEEECKECYVKQCEKYIDGLKRQMKQKNEYFEEEIEKYNALSKEWKED